MEASYNTPLRAPALGSSGSRWPQRGGGGGGWSSVRELAPTPSPRAPTPDRYIAARTAQDNSLSRFFLTTKENLTPVLALTERRDAGGAAGLYNHHNNAAARVVGAAPLRHASHTVVAQQLYDDGDEHDDMTTTTTTAHVRVDEEGDNSDSDSSAAAAALAVATMAAVARRRIDDSGARDDNDDDSSSRRRRHQHDDDDDDVRVGSPRRVLFASPLAAPATPFSPLSAPSAVAAAAATAAATATATATSATSVAAASPWSPDATLRSGDDDVADYRAASPPAHAPATMFSPRRGTVAAAARTAPTTPTTTTTTTTAAVVAPPRATFSSSPSPAPAAVLASVSRMTAAAAAAAAVDMTAVTGSSSRSSRHRLSRGASPALVDMLAKMRLDSVSVPRMAASSRPRHTSRGYSTTAAGAGGGGSVAAAAAGGGGSRAGSGSGSSGGSGGGGTGAVAREVGASSPYRGCSPMDVEPYTSRLARTLFSSTPQRSVLTLHTQLATTTSSAPRPAQSPLTPSPSAAPPLPRAGVNVDDDGGSERRRYNSALGVIYEHNRLRNFRSASFRLITQTPERILDAADLVDDYYLNLLDWSTSNVLCVALQNAVYLWDATTCDISRLPPSPTATTAETIVCAVQWAADGRHLAVGLADGGVEVWDVAAQQVVYQCAGADGSDDSAVAQRHGARVGTLSWCTSSGLLASGSKDATIHMHDLRERHSSSSSSSVVGVLHGHAQEVCGLRWSPHNGGVYLASGGNDNLLLVWDRRRLRGASGAGSGYDEAARTPWQMHGATPTMATTTATSFAAATTTMTTMRSPQPVLCLDQHTAAVKALAWHPTQSSLLASGGGTGDRTLRFWNTLTGDCVRHVNTQSQVCGVQWSRDGRELVSAHGFSHNQLTIWRYPSLRRVADLRGHTSRVLHLCVSPDGEVVVSAASDETIRFWRCFAPADKDDDGDDGDDDGTGLGHASSAIHASRTSTAAGVAAEVRAPYPVLQPPPPLTYLATRSPHRGYNYRRGDDEDDDDDDDDDERAGDDSHRGSDAATAASLQRRRRRRGVSVACHPTGGIDGSGAAAALSRRAVSLASAAMYTNACAVSTLALR